MVLKHICIKVIVSLNAHKQLMKIMSITHVINVIIIVKIVMLTILIARNVNFRADMKPFYLITNVIMIVQMDFSRNMIPTPVYVPKVIKILPILLHVRYVHLNVVNALDH